jgi:hypothetical protein
MPFSRLLCVASLGVVYCGLNLSLLEAADKPIDFNRDIRPILSDTCYKCHGFDEKERKGGLRLDTQEGALAKLESGSHAVVPGKSAESELFVRITSQDPNEKMPPPNSGRSLTPQQIDLLKRWIDGGAKMRGHWSFTAPVRAEPPTVARKDLVHNPIDQFILSRLEKEGLAPSAAAEKLTLLRRVTFDLTGMPPTLADIDAYMADNSPQAYERVVDRLLASPRYGEHMARYWLDAARYGDTHGLHLDNERSMWPYRDWVISAFNNNMPFNQFTIEQLAGDMLPNATVEQRIATGFNRCNVSTSEGGSINEEVLVRYAVDRVETTSTVWMGLTTGCAVCHDHKFDPITQKEFYQLFAFFNASSDAAMDGNALLPAPIVKRPTMEQTTQQTSLTQQIADTKKKIADELAKIEYIEPNPESAAPTAEPKEYVWIEDALPPGAQAQGNPPGWEFVGAPDHPVFSGEKSNRRSAKGLTQHFFTGANPGLKIGEGDKLFAFVYLDPKDPPQEIMLQFNDGVWEHRAYWGGDVIPWGAANTVSRAPIGPLPEAGKWVRLEVDIAKVGLAPGAVLNGWAFTQHDGTVYWDKAGIVTRTPQDGQSFDSLLAWDTYERAQSKSTLPQPVQGAVKTEPEKRNDEQKKQIRDYFLENVYAKTKGVFDPLHKQVADLTKQQTDVENAVPATLVMQDGQMRDTFILVRGAYDKHGDKVTAGTPAVLPPMPADTQANRLGLAKWLVDPAHPLTARVIVNRYWQQYFGTGIVKTAEDFGSQGAMPTHPELLDWLATEFISSGWNVKQLQKLIVMSATYQQSSRVSPELVQRDPTNELLARGPRFRLDAEVIRDSALDISGLLIDRAGGKSVKPYQPGGVWESVAFVGSNTSAFTQDHGEALYRRSMYTFWKRTSPPPALLTFDAPSRETCTVRRARTNTPLQALVLMNDQQYVEAARRLAERMITQGGATPEDRATFAFRLATGRKPTLAELAVVLQVYQGELADFQADKDAATKLVTVGETKRNEALDVSELAAWTMTANLILNLDETVTKE